MKALVKKESTRGLWLEDVPEPEVGIKEAFELMESGNSGKIILDWK